MRKEKNSNIHWHPAFVEAIKMELKPYLDKIEILPEFPLTTEPLKIDCIIIKKTKNLVIEKNIASIFRGWNIIEYKSPQDHVSVNDFHKVYAYSCLYSVLFHVPVDNMTISFVESRYPKKLIDFLINVRNYKVEKNNPGIYNVKGDVFAIQIIDTRHLSGYENLWLKSLNGKLNTNSINKVVSEIKKQDKTINIEAYIDVISRANEKFFKEELKMGAKSFKELVMTSDAVWIKEWLSKIEAKSIKKGMEKGMAEGMEKGKEKGEAEALAFVARNLKSDGMSNSLIAQYTGLSLAKIRKL